MNIYKVQKAVTQTILAWVNEESEYKEIAVDKGNIDTFIREVNETLTDVLTKELKVDVTRPKAVVTPETTNLHFESEYYSLKKAYAQLEEENKKLVTAVVNLALQIKDVE